ncbi:hypothetical protein IPC790_07410 [Pseudomonas aeruginosa]|nr:hypothetical protein IPC790_07410 [Pseudomonas aeruginosa]
MNSLVLSGAILLVLSGVCLSCYQEYGCPCRPRLARPPASLNVTNLKALTCCRADAPWWAGAEGHGWVGEIRP